MPITNPFSGYSHVAAGHFQRVGGAATADVSETGLGFAPSMLILIGGDSTYYSFGLGDASQANCMCTYGVAGTMHNEVGFLAQFGTGSAGQGQTAVIKSFDSDGFTLTWTKVGAGIGITADCIYLAIG